MSSCLFCGSLGPFSSIEHIVPESLGNDQDVLVEEVCDLCQRYLGTSVERPCLEATPFAVWRVLLGTKTKKGRLPHIRLDRVPKGGRNPATHPALDRVGFTAHPDGSTSLDVYDDSFAKSILTGRRRDVRLVLTPWHLSLMGRLLGKMGLEYLASVNKDLARCKRFDALRNYVRRGSTTVLWPIIHSSQGAVCDLVTRVQIGDHEACETVECYRYSLAETTATAEKLFAFGIGTDVFLISLEHPKPSEELTGYLDGEAQCLWYSRSETTGAE